MPLHKDSICAAVRSALKQSGVTVPDNQLCEIISLAIYNVLNSREFERYIRDIVK